MENKLELTEVFSDEVIGALYKKYSGYGYELVIKYFIPEEGEELDILGNKSARIYNDSAYAPKLSHLGLGSNFLIRFPNREISMERIPLVLEKVQDAQDFVKEFIRRKEELFDFSSF